MKMLGWMSANILRDRLTNAHIHKKLETIAIEI